MTMRLGFAAALCFTSLVACRSGEGGDGGDAPQAPWTFGNTVDRQAFAARLKDLETLTGRAQRLGLPTRDTRASTLPTGALAFAEPRAGADCTDDVAVFGLASRTAAPDGFRLAEGQSCGDAVRQIRSFYAQALDGAQLTVRRLGLFKPGGAHCGWRIDEDVTDVSVAAVAYTLTPLDSVTGEVAKQSILGAADEARVAFLSTIGRRCDGGECTSGESIDGRSEAIANLRNSTLDLSHSFRIASVAADAGTGGIRQVVTELESTLAISGLAQGAHVRAEETATVVDGADGSRVGLGLVVEEVSDGRLRLSGSVTSDKAPAEAFQVDLVRQGDLCRVVLDPGPKPATPFDPRMMVGAWESPCTAGSFGRLGAGRAQERFHFADAGGREVARALTIFDDEECFGGHETARITLKGTYSLSGQLPSGESGAHEEGVDFEYRDLEVLVVDAELVQRFNDLQLCGVDGWAVGIPRTFAATRCFFDLGTDALLATESMKRAAEYTAFKPEPPRRFVMARTDALAGGHADTRARYSSDAKVHAFAKVETRH